MPKQIGSEAPQKPLCINFLLGISILPVLTALTAGISPAMADMNPVQNTTQSVSSVNSVSSETTSSDTTAGWKKYAHNPVLGGALGTCFDISVLKDGRTFRMWFSWRPRKSIALVESQDGFHWSEPVIALGPNPHNNWESDLNRPSVIKVGKTYHMWYTGQTADKSWIGHAISTDGKTWQRLSDKPELSAAQPWEKTSVMCPDVMWDKTKKLFRMWYSGGEQYEPNAIGYATSRDGIHWTKLASNPIFLADPNTAWEQHKVTACHVVQQGKWYVMFYIGFHTEDYAQIGIARSRDGVTNWQRHPANPIIRPTPNGWDASATYKPFVIWDGKRWMLWYNGRHDSFEQIGVATHEGKDLGFEKFDARVGK